MNKITEKKYEDLIIDIITQNPRYQGNEDLLKYIYDDVLIRLGGILDSITDEVVIRSYIERIVKLSIITVIKKRAILLSESSKPEPKKNVIKQSGYYDEFNYPELGINKQAFSDEKKQELESELRKFINLYPQKELKKLYNLRFIEKKSLEQISDELNVSQAQAAERLFELASLVKRIFGNEVSQV